jgi:penicillin-binding protein 2
LWNQYNTRLYTNGVAPHAIGYISSIQKDESDQYLRLGYSPAARIGRIGIEKWAENYLAGKTGGTLYIAGKDGTIISALGKSDPKPASSIRLTIDKNLQYQAQKAIEGFRGAIVVLERNNGKVLAMASSPGYDPNFFDPNNDNNETGVAALVNDATTPLINRATQSKYPLGSVFKVITFSAALESGTYTPDTKRDCPYEFTELADKVRYDWTWEHFQDELLATGEGKTRPSGMLTLSDGLMRSCNPWFWHIGKDLYDQGRVTAIADMARGFGLGATTGIGEIEEDAGTIINPPGEVEAVNQAIGQGDVQVTPLQVARMMAAIGNGGTLYRPQLVEEMTDANGIVTQIFKPDANSKPLPITHNTLIALQQAMLKVIREHRGTAYPRFQGITANIAIYGKTGTAESGNGRSHAWFAGYTDAQNPDLPDIAIAVIAENAGEGSQVAAPMFKRIVETYFTGNPRSPYPWETSIGVTRTPTEPITPTVGPPP